MEKNYDHKQYEDKIISAWEKSGVFAVPTYAEATAGKPTKKPFCIIMPPPNANDPLHVGHAMFVTIEDTSSSLELLVFPRTYETTKDIWQEGKIVVVMGKTSESEDDDKLFVEKAYELAEQTAPAIFAQLGMGQSLTSPPSTGGGRGWGLGDRPEPKEKVKVTGDMVEIIVPENRLDLNIEKNELKDSLRLERAAESTRFLLKIGCRVVILSYKGQLDIGKVQRDKFYRRSYSLRPVTRELSRKLRQSIDFVDDLNPKNWETN